MLDLSKEIEQALDVLIKVEKQPSKKRKLLEKGKVVYLQVVLFKIPFVAPRKRKFLKLRHSLYGDEPEICLFVPNRKTGVEYKKTTDELIDFCVDYYTNFLEKHKVKKITTVMPLKQLRSEYGTYELRRKLARRFDLFLCKNSLLYNPRFLTALGKTFYVTNKLPFGVPFPKEDVDFDPDFQKSIEKAILTSSFYINRFSDNYSIPFGCLSNTKAELTENLEAVLQQIFEEKVIPGGLQNIRALYLLPSQSKPIPLFLNTELPSDAKRPRLKGKRRKLRGVEGELSSQPHKKVFVMPNGEVFVTNIRKKKSKVQPEVDYSEDEESFKDESDADDGFEEKNGENLKFNNKMTGNEEESESENDEAIEEKEARLLKLKEEVEAVSFGNKKSKNVEEEGDEEEEYEEDEEDEEDEDEEEEDEENHVKMNKKHKLKTIENAKQNNNKRANSKKTKVNKSKKKMLIKKNKFNTIGKAVEMQKSKRKNNKT